MKTKVIFQLSKKTVSPGMRGLKIAFVSFMEIYKIESISPIYDFLPTVSLELLRL